MRWLIETQLQEVDMQVKVILSDDEYKSFEQDEDSFKDEIKRRLERSELGNAPMVIEAKCAHCNGQGSYELAV